ncbi:MAG: PAS domain-containing sensor histidine kinase [Cyclobacteriaceae bacterium]|nr:PAS domain-containing sensor histidine kinase [Cyclobacteriaceae bacterium]MDX5465956.1 PAS domain-containing sensor histidine kinase [Cyclobacteriaceae bacterium]
MSKSDFNYELFFDLSPDLFCIAGYDGYFKRVNPAVVKTLGYTVEELFSRPVNDFIHPDDQKSTAEMREQLHRSHPLHYFENRYLTKSGEVVWLQWTSMPVEEQNLVFAIAKNITHKKRQDADRNALLAQLTQINEDLRRFSYMTSHDLRTPVNNLISAFKLLDIQKISDPDTIEILEILKLSSQSLKNTLNSYVDTLVGSSSDQNKKEPVSLIKTLETVMNSIPNLIRDSKAEVRFNFSKVQEVDFNPILLESILLNLLTNSIKYAKPGQAPTIEIWTVMADQKKQLHFKDFGIGMDLEKVGDRIFGLQQKFNSDLDSKGVGLYLVHHHVTKMGGKIEVSSALGEGAHFTITF